jgi:hypothetical protein
MRTVEQAALVRVRLDKSASMKPQISLTESYLATLPQFL